MRGALTSVSTYKKQRLAAAPLVYGTLLGNPMACCSTRAFSTIAPAQIATGSAQIATGLWSQNLHVNRNGKSRAQPAGNPHAWVCFRQHRPNEALHSLKPNVGRCRRVLCDSSGLVWGVCYRQKTWVIAVRTYSVGQWLLFTLAYFLTSTVNQTSASEFHT